jgi:hypothetical protein
MPRKIDLLDVVVLGGLSVIDVIRAMVMALQDHRVVKGSAGSVVYMGIGARSAQTRRRRRKIRVTWLTMSMLKLILRRHFLWLRSATLFAHRIQKHLGSS